MQTPKIYQIIRLNKPKTLSKSLCNVKLYDVYVTPIYNKNNGETTVCKVIYYKEQPGHLPRIYLGKRLYVDNKLLVPTEVFPTYAYSTTAWLERIRKFDTDENKKEIVNALIGTLDKNRNDLSLYSLKKTNEVTSVAIKRVRITSTLIKPGRVFIGPDKITIVKVYGDIVYYTVNTELKKVKKIKLWDLISLLNRGKYGVYPFWVDLIKDVRTLLKPFLGTNAIAWVLEWMLNQMGVT